MDYKKASCRPQKPTQKFAEGGVVGPFDRYLNTYDKMRRSDNVEDRRDNDADLPILEPKAIRDEAVQRYVNQPTKVTRLGADAGLLDIDQTPFRDEHPSYIKVSKKR